MDSLSFTFLSYVSWEVATVLAGKLKVSKSDIQVEGQEQTRRSFGVTLLASFLMMYLDIIIDPVALRGDRWFLGKIYYYPEGGIYFGITIANFIGWFFVCFVIIRLFLAVDKLILARASKVNAGVLAYRHKALGAVGLYFGVLGFNLFMTFWIGEMLLGIVGVIIVLPLAVMIALVIFKSVKYSH